MTADGGGSLGFRRQFGGVHGLDRELRLLVDLREELGVEGARAALGIRLFQRACERLRTRHVDAERAALPEQELEHALRQALARRRELVPFREHVELETRHVAARALEREGQQNAVLLNRAPVRAKPQVHRPVPAIERRNHVRGLIEERVDHEGRRS